MQTVRFHCEGYTLYAEHQKKLFSSSDQHGDLFHSGTEVRHNLLFGYEAADIRLLSQRLERYVGQYIDTETLAFKDGSGDEEIHGIMLGLAECHPYYRYTALQVVVESICVLFNDLVIRVYGSSGFTGLDDVVGVIRQEMEDGDWEADAIEYSDKSDDEIESMMWMENIRKEIVEQDIYEWYTNSIIHILEYPDNVPESVDDEVDDIIDQHFVELRKAFTLAVRGEVDTSICACEGFKYEAAKQDVVRQMLFWILDLSAPVVGGLSVPLRQWLYYRLFEGYLYYDRIPAWDEPSLCSAPRETDTGTAVMAEIRANLTAECGAGLQLYSYHLDPDAIPQSGLDALRKATAHTEGLSEGDIIAEYKVNGIGPLLMLELMHMIKDNTVIKRCKLCGLYFEVNNLNERYCDRVWASKGESKPCSMIGSRQTYKRKLQDDPYLRIYNKAYKKYYARKMNGTMSEGAFDEWYAVAKASCDRARSGELVISVKDYETLINNVKYGDVVNGK